MSRSELPLGGMCRDNHIEIHYSLALMGNDERCPACKLRDDLLAKVRRVVEQAASDVRLACISTTESDAVGALRGALLSRLDKL